MGYQFKNKTEKIAHRASVLSMRIDSGLTNKQIAKRLGITSQRVSQIMCEAYDYVKLGRIKLPEGWEITNIGGRTILRTIRGTAYSDTDSCK